MESSDKSQTTGSDTGEGDRTNRIGWPRFRYREQTLHETSLIRAVIQLRLAPELFEGGH